MAGEQIRCLETAGDGSRKTGLSQRPPTVRGRTRTR